MSTEDSDVLPETIDEVVETYRAEWEKEFTRAVKLKAQNDQLIRQINQMVIEKAELTRLILAAMKTTNLSVENDVE